MYCGPLVSVSEYKLRWSRLRSSSENCVRMLDEPRQASATQSGCSLTVGMRSCIPSSQDEIMRSRALHWPGQNREFWSSRTRTHRRGRALLSDSGSSGSDAHVTCWLQRAAAVANHAGSSKSTYCGFCHDSRATEAA